MAGSCDGNSAGTGGGVEPVAPFVWGFVMSRIVLCESIQCSGEIPKQI